MIMAFFLITMMEQEHDDHDEFTMISKKFMSSCPNKG